MTETNQTLGIVVSGSVEKGVDIRLDALASVEDMVVGRYVTIEGRKRRFFGMITDISLGVTDEAITATPPDSADPLYRRGAGRYSDLWYSACSADAYHWR